jgi:hypothetical protein
MQAAATGVDVRGVNDRGRRAKEMMKDVVERANGDPDRRGGQEANGDAGQREGQKAVRNLVVCLAAAGEDQEAKSLTKNVREGGAVKVLLKNVRDLWAQLNGEGGVGKAVETIGGKFDTMKSELQKSYDNMVKAETTHAKEAQPCSNGNNAECDGITCGKMK